MRGRIGFFSGGTALRELSRHMAATGVLSRHFISTFDSGGSSAQLRKTFAMPAVGDMRNRLLALSRAPAAVYEFCNYRLPKSGVRADLLGQLAEFASPLNEAYGKMPPETSRIFQEALRHFLDKMTSAFNPAGASIGNVILTGMYLERKRDFIPALALLGSALETYGTVLPITSANANLGALLENGQYIVGQHLFESLPAPVEQLFLTVHESAAAQDNDNVKCNPPLLPEIVPHIASLNLLCYPPGSFYSSVLANLLVKGCGEAISRCGAVKAFIPNSGGDPESSHLSLVSQAMLIIDTLQKDAPRSKIGDFLHYLLIDSRNGVYPGGITPGELNMLSDMGITVIDRPIVKPDNPKRHDPQKLLSLLLELEAKGCHQNS